MVAPSDLCFPFQGLIDCLFYSSGRNPTQSGLGQSGVGNENVLAHIKKKQTQRESFSIMAGLSNAFKAQSHGLSISQLRFIGINCIVSHTLLCSSYNHHD